MKTLGSHDLGLSLKEEVFNMVGGGGCEFLILCGLGIIVCRTFTLTINCSKLSLSWGS